jgi:hypothetical protein
MTRIISGNSISLAFGDIRPAGTNLEFERLYSECQNEILYHNLDLEIGNIEGAKYHKQKADAAYLAANKIK